MADDAISKAATAVAIRNAPIILINPTPVWICQYYRSVSGRSNMMPLRPDQYHSEVGAETNREPASDRVEGFAFEQIEWRIAIEQIVD